ncbi:MAG: PGPGW domain-containing protein [Candidatus Paceibacterota bacterium]
MKIYTLSRPRLKKTLGWVLIVLGIIALVAPIVPGLVLIAIALELLGIRFVFIDKLLKRNSST